MRTTESETNDDLSWWSRSWRDLALLGHLASMTVYYWTSGARLRKAYRDCEASGKVFWVDDDPAETERRLR